MWIAVEFNPDLALRNYEKFLSWEKLKEECIPKTLLKWKKYEFLKKWQRLYWLNNDKKWDYWELPLLETKWNENLSRPIASIKIIEVTHFIKNWEIWTKWIYKVIEIFEDDNKIYFETYKRVK